MNECRISTRLSSHFSPGSGIYMSARDHTCTPTEDTLIVVRAQPHWHNHSSHCQFSSGQPQNLREHPCSFSSSTFILTLINFPPCFHSAHFHSSRDITRVFSNLRAAVIFNQQRTILPQQATAGSTPSELKHPATDINQLPAAATEQQKQQQQQRSHSVSFTATLH